MKNKTVLEKAIYNSFCPIYIPNFIPFNNIEKANKVTEEGRKALREMMKKNVNLL